MIYSKSQSDGRNSELMTFRISQSRVLGVWNTNFTDRQTASGWRKAWIGVHSYSIFDSIYSPLEAPAFVNVGHEQPEIANTSSVYS